MWWFSPLMFIFCLMFACLFNLMSGRFTGEELINLYSRSPLCIGFWIVCIYRLLVLFNVGEITQGRSIILLSFSPLLIMVCWYLFALFSVGEIHRRGGENVTLVLPLWTDFESFFEGLFLTTFLGAFCRHQICYDPRLCGGMHRWPRALYCIYIV